MPTIKWKSQEQIEQEKLDAQVKPKQEEIDKAKRDLEVIDLLVELGVI